MEHYRRNLGVRDKGGASRGALPSKRFKYECAWACHLGTDDAAEFGRHIAECRHILDGVRIVAARMLAKGIPVVVSGLEPRDKPGQMEIPGTPKSVRMKTRR